MTSLYLRAGYTVYWSFPTALERIAVIPLLAEINKVALQEDNNSLWILRGILPNNWVPAGNLSYVPLKSFDKEEIPADHQRLVYGNFEIVGDLTLTGDLVLL